MLTCFYFRCLYYGVAAVLIISLSSCQSPHFYRPRTLEPVLLSHEKQLTANVIGDEITAVSIAYSPVSHLGIQSGTGLASGKKNANEETYFNPYIAAGYYKMLSSISLVEVYGGLGVYNYKNKIDVPVKAINFSNYFLQPSFAILSKNVDVAFTIRGDYLKRNKTVIDDINPPDTSTLQYSFLKYDNYFFLQPGITIRAGIKHIKFQLQVNKSIPLNKKYNSIYGVIYNSSTVVDNHVKLAIGIMIDFEDIIKKKS